VRAKFLESAYRSPSRVGGGEVLDLEPRKGKKMELIELNGGFPAWQVAETPFGVEKIDDRDYVVFRLWNGNRVYLRDKGFTSRDMACLYLEGVVENYRASIIEAVR
jgi:hypothetical protein